MTRTRPVTPARRLPRGGAGAESRTGRGSPRAASGSPTARPSSAPRGQAVEGRSARARRAAAAEPHLREGTALLARGDFAAAERELREALALDPKCAGAWVNLGGILLGRLDFAEAVEANRRAARADPRLAMAHVNQAIGLLHMGKVRAAVTSLGRAVKLEPRNGAAYHLLAVALEALGQDDEAKLCAAYASELGYSTLPSSPGPLAVTAEWRARRDPAQSDCSPTTHSHGER